MSSPLVFSAFSTALLSGESREELEALFEAYLAEYQPLTVTEERAISEMVDAEWRLRRLRQSQLNRTTLSPGEFRKFESHLIRLYDRALHNLLRRIHARAQAPRHELPNPITTTESTGVDMHGVPN